MIRPESPRDSVARGERRKGLGAPSSLRLRFPDMGDPAITGSWLCNVESGIQRPHKSVRVASLPLIRPHVRELFRHYDFLIRDPWQRVVGLPDGW